MTWEITFYDEKLQNELLQLPAGMLAKTRMVEVKNADT
jgi:hypothetical protein